MHKFSCEIQGRVVAVKNSIIHAELPLVALGDLVKVATKSGQDLMGVVVGFTDNYATIAPYSNMNGVQAGSIVRGNGETLQIRVGDSIFGKVLDCFGEPLPCQTKLGVKVDSLQEMIPIKGISLTPLERVPISEPVLTGIRAIDLFSMIGFGQRIGVFAPAGVGKTTLMMNLCQNSQFDIIISALIGERGREVADFKDHFKDFKKPLIIVASTSDEAAQRRILAAHTAMAIAEYYREKSLKVLLVLDSLTRFGRAVREVGLAAGEVPIKGGYTPSIYSALPELIERSGRSLFGSITLVATVLLEGRDGSDPIAEEVKSLLDGHIYLTHEQRLKGILPAFDPIDSQSRLFEKLATPDHQKLRRFLLQALARIKRDRELVLMGGEPDNQLKLFLKHEAIANQLISQVDSDSYCSLDSELQKLKEVVDKMYDETQSV
jgi:ATP synthase in type III secretion protein N